MATNRKNAPEQVEPQQIGPDGWPVDNPPSIRDRWDPLSDPREEYWRRSLATCERAWLAGNLLALFDAVALCAEYDRPLPPWIAKAVLDTVADQFTRAAPGGRVGRHAVPRKAYIENHIHYMRWDAVRELRDRRDELQGWGYEPTWDAVYENAAKGLKRSIAAGKPDAIKRSYQLVEKAFRIGTGAKFYQSRYFDLRKSEWVR